MNGQVTCTVFPVAQGRKCFGRQVRQRSKMSTDKCYGQVVPPTISEPIKVNKTAMRPPISPAQGVN